MSKNEKKSSALVYLPIADDFFLPVTRSIWV